MSSTGSIDHHRSIKFVEAEMPADPSFVVTLAPDRKTVTISGVCPACGGRTVSDYPYGIGGTGYKGFPRRSTGPTAVPSTVTVICECGHSHPDRPTEAPDLGCGRFWTVELRLS
jgi:hypothetical protein